jgi:hypothetical protein
VAGDTLSILTPTTDATLSSVTMTFAGTGERSFSTMSIQYSGGTNVNALFTGNVKNDILTNVYNQLVTAGWTVVPCEPVPWIGPFSP